MAIGKVKALANRIQDLENLEHIDLPYYNANLQKNCDLLVARIEGKTQSMVLAFDVSLALFINDSFFSKEDLEKLDKTHLAIVHGMYALKRR